MNITWEGMMLSEGSKMKGHTHTNTHVHVCIEDERGKEGERERPYTILL